MSRLPTLPVAALNDRQRQVYEIISRGPREFVVGPIRALLLNPDLAEKVQSLGAFCHYGNSFEARLTELAILVVAREYTCQFEWVIHAPIAINKGLSADIVEAIRTRREPKFDKEDEAVIYAYSSEMMRNKRVSQATHERMVKAFSEVKVAELIGLLGYFTLLAMTLNGFELGIPEGTPPLAD